MEKTEWMNATKASISDVLETMFFLPIEFSEWGGLGKLEPPENDLFLGCRLSFTGPFSGFLLFLVPSKLARSLTASFLGEEEGEVGDAEVTGTVKEILNMVTGKSFSILDDAAVFELGLPEATASWELALSDSEECADRFTLLIHTVDATSVLRACILH